MAAPIKFQSRSQNPCKATLTAPTMGQEEETLFNCANKIEPLKCHQCSTFKTYKLVHLTNHLKAGHTLFKFEEKRYKCRRCNFQTGSKFLSLRHKLVKLCSRIGTIRMKKADSYTLKWFKCNECSYETLGPSLLEIHMKLRHPRCKKTKTFKCEIRTYYKTSNSDSSKGNLTPQSSPVKPIEKKLHLVNPLPSANQEIFHHCNYCSYKAPSEILLRKHKNALHNNFLKCKYCPFAAKSRQHVNTHIRNKHTEIIKKWFKCEHCPYKNQRKSVLKLHLYKKHGIIENMKNDHSSFETQQESSSESDTLTEQSDLEKIEWFECEWCSFKCKVKFVLTEHVTMNHRSRTKFKCSHCSFETNHKHSLKCHTLTQHTEEEKVQWFQCKFCSYKGKTPSLLTQHLRNKHTIRDNWKCDYCPFETKYKSSLENHTLTQHKQLRNVQQL